MSSISIDPTETPVTYVLPCSVCRRRKVRCSKTSPCDNCQRAGATCSYEDASRRPARHTEISHRLSRVESLIRNSYPLSDPTTSVNSVPINDADDETSPARTMEDLMSRLEQRYKQQLAVSHLSNLNLKPGKLAYVEGSSRHIHGRFWAGRYEEVCWFSWLNLRF